MRPYPIRAISCILREFSKAAGIIIPGRLYHVQGTWLRLFYDGARLRKKTKISPLLDEVMPVLGRSLLILRKSFVLVKDSKPYPVPGMNYQLH